MTEKNGYGNSGKKIGLANTRLLRRIINVLSNEANPLNKTMINNSLIGSFTSEQVTNGLLFLISLSVVRKVRIKVNYGIRSYYFYEMDPLWEEFQRMIIKNKKTIREVNGKLG